MPDEDEQDIEVRSITGYGIGSAVLGLLCVGAVVLITLIWTGHRAEETELRNRAAAMQAAADWTRVLINMNAGNVEPSLQTLHDGTVGELNADFDAAVAPYRDVVQTLQSSTTGDINAVAVETVRNNLDVEPGSAPPPEEPPLQPGIATRTDTVLVIATSVSENSGGEPRTVRWNLRLDVSDVDGRLLISRLESMR
ncbi:hypothetical protein BVC93_15205 [Mycobacterium sp. MS1601]|uniref:hypothetical protein n=1 Tax=Mycobacterium sp. MS1601 TaxID=1936029 RepID=UPI0009793100|nr:hypothetical protein [Mycobacterium sp. MS1601]AQA03537.1 hypothetical protein BVC93_15205 [Mycobacterium sp. MS1601]